RLTAPATITSLVGRRTTIMAVAPTLFLAAYLCQFQAPPPPPPPPPPGAPIMIHDKHWQLVDSAAAVVEEIGAIPERAIPAALLRDAQGIAIIPGVIKVGFVLSGRFGRGVMV